MNTPLRETPNCSAQRFAAEGSISTTPTTFSPLRRIGVNQHSPKPPPPIRIAVFIEVGSQQYFCTSAVVTTYAIFSHIGVTWAGISGHWPSSGYFAKNRFV